MNHLKVVSFSNDRYVTFTEEYGAGGDTRRPVIGETHHYIQVEILGSSQLWKLKVPEGFIEALMDKPK